MSSLRRRPLLLALIVIVLALVAVFVIVKDGGPGDDKSSKVVIPLKLPGPDVKVQADKNQSLDAGEQREAKDASIDLHEDAKDETPPNVPAAALRKGQQATKALAEKELVTPERAGGAQGYSCRRHPVVNQSALSQRRVGVALHFTVSNPGSLPAIFGLFNRPSFGASSNYGFELFNLRCEQWVPEGRKAWAQGAANSAYVSIEIISKDRSRASWLASPALKRGTLAALVRDIARRVGTPLRHVDPVGCVWRPGIVDHDALECGNTHWDVGRNFPWDVFMAQVRRGTSRAPLTKRQRQACDLLNFHRAKAHAAGKWTPARARRGAELQRKIPTGRCRSKYR